MKIGIVMNPYGETTRSGLGRTAPEITRAIIEGDGSEENEYVVFVKGRHSEYPAFRGNYVIEECSPGFLWQDRALWNRSDLDVVFFITPFIPLFFHPWKSVVMVHDLEHFRNRRFTLNKVLVRFMHAQAIRRATIVAAISQETKKDILRFIKIRKTKLHVIRQGFTKVCDSPPREVPGIKKPFLLSVGVVKERKNTLRIIEAFGILKTRKKIPHTLIVAGSLSHDKYSDRIRAVMGAHNLTNEVQFLTFKDDRKLSFLYREADVLVYPTLHEGFGAPIMEAMHCGLPVVTSNLPVHRETAGPAGCFTNPRDSGDIARVIYTLLSDKREIERQKQIGKLHAQSYSWEHTAAAYRDVFRSLVEEN